MTVMIDNETNAAIAGAFECPGINHMKLDPVRNFQTVAKSNNSECAMLASD